MSDFRGPHALQALLDRRTQGAWKAAYWPLPEPHYWIGVLPESSVPSKMEKQLTGPIPNRQDAELMELAPLLAELVLAMSKKISEYNGETDYCLACDEEPSRGHDPDCPLVKLGKVVVHDTEGEEDAQGA